MYISPSDHQLSWTKTHVVRLFEGNTVWFLACFVKRVFSYGRGTLHHHATGEIVFIGAMWDACISNRPR